MTLQGKISVLAALLIADLMFFLFVRVEYPEIFEAALNRLPWEDDLEEAVFVISGYVVAVLSSSAIIYVLTKHFQRTVQ
ncbi:MAG: hypothetical protein NWE76_08810 [Candidatus Bathyarchaeota archaeon]|nr:hypothetical protein [Candidatus Bathyarchaeota archaeon]